MSASRERKKRVAQNAASQPEVKKEKKKLSEGWIFAICIILVVALVFGGIFLYRHYQAHRTVLTVGDHEVEVYEFNYFYRDLAASVDSYATYFGIDNTKPLDEQKVASASLSMAGLFGINTTCLEGKEVVDGAYNVTWAELLSDNAMRNAASAYAVYQEATKAGFQLDEEDYAEFDTIIAEIKTYADLNAMSVDEYIEEVFGRGCDEESYRHYLEVTHTASHYPETLTYTAEELAARYDEAPEEFDTVAFYYYATDASTIQAKLEAEAAEGEDETAEGEDETAEGETEAVEGEKEKLDLLAKDAAEAMAKEFNIDDDGVKVYADYNRQYLEEMLYSVRMPEEAVTWLYEEAVADEVKMFTIEEDPEVEDDETLYVVLKFITNENYNTYNYISITVADDAEDAELAEGEKTAEEKVAEIKASLEADPSEENFRALVLANLDHTHAEGEEHDHDHSNEGVAENQSRYSFTSVSKELYAWMTIEPRATGDWTMIELEGKTVFYFYLGEGENYNDICVENTLLNEWYTELTEAAIAACDYDKDAALAAKVGFYS